MAASRDPAPTSDRGADGDRVVGTVSRITVYPVKSLGGRTLASTGIDAAGLPGDRAHTVVDPGTGRRVDAKENPRIAGIVASGDVAHDTARLVAVLGRPVRLQPRPAGAPEGAAVHLVSSQGLARAAAGDVPHGCTAEDPRANLVVTLTSPDDDERAWVGRRLRLGTATLEVTCRPKHCLGVYAEVVEPGTVSAGDAVVLGRVAAG